MICQQVFEWIFEAILFRTGIKIRTNNEINKSFANKTFPIFIQLKQVKAEFSQPHIDENARFGTNKQIIIRP